MKDHVILAALAAAVALAALLVSAPAHAQNQSCIQSEIVGRLLRSEAERIGGAVETIRDATEIARYIRVINEEPPSAGPAETLLILVHPKLQVARVFLVHLGSVCERYLIGPDMHRKAWTAARGTTT